MQRFTPDRYPDLIYDEQGRVRVKIVQAEGTPLPGGFVAADPEEAVKNMNQVGWCEEDAYCEDIGYNNPKIMLDNGHVIWGYQCWWAPIKQSEVN